jgi:lipoprotein signal peptidase
MVHNTLNRKLNIEQHWNQGVNWSFPQGLAVPALVVEHVVWLMLSVYILMSFDFPFVKLFGVG